MKRVINIKNVGAPALAALALGLAAVSAHAAPTHGPLHARPHRAARVAASTGPASASVILKIDGALTPTRQAALQSLGADVTRRLDFIHCVAVTVPRHNLARIAALPFITHVSDDGMVRKCDDFTDGNTGAYTAFKEYGLDGTGVTVALVDSGVGNSSDLAGEVLDSVSFVPADHNPNDACGHGTHVAGIVAGNGRSSTKNCFRTFYGVARNANLVNVRVLDRNGQGTVSSVLAGIQWVVQNKSNDGIQVMNLSLGHPVTQSYTTDPLCQAVEAAWKAGIVVVCAAGNSGRAGVSNVPGAPNEGWGTAYGSINSPGNDPYVITVGAVKSTDGQRAHDRIATYSGRGPSRLDLILKPDIIAPGNRVISLVSKNSLLFTYNGGTNQIPQSYYANSGHIADPSNVYFRLSGTSMAAPVVAGAAALLLQADPKLSPDTVKARLMVSADKWAAPDASGTPTGQADPCTYGAGYLDIPAALQSSIVATQPALSPTLVMDASGNVSISTAGITSASHIIWGTGTINDLHIIWGTNAILGSSTLSSSHIIWGTSGVFADHIIWGTCLTGGVDLSSVVVNGE